MRGARTSSGTRAQSPFNPLPASIFNRLVTGLPVTASRTAAERISNQLAYNRNAGSGDAWAHWNGYAGPGYINAGKGRSKLQIGTFSLSVFVVPAGQPTTRVTYVNALGEPEPPGAANHLQSYWEHVPLPTLAEIPSGHLICPIGTDKWLCVIQGNRMWEFWKFNPEANTAQYGGFVSNLSQWNGIFTNGWGARATGLAQIAGMISTQDMVEILQGKKLKHALCVDLPVTKTGGAPVPPATRKDENENTLQEWPGAEPNPAYGVVDAVAEGSWSRFPPAAKPGEYGIHQATEPIAWAIFEAIREYGLFVSDSAGQSTPTFYVQFPTELGSPYAWARVCPYYKAPAEWGKYMEGEGSGENKGWVPLSMALQNGKPVLPAIEEENVGTVSALSKQPWQTLEQLEPRAS